jgi:hypothetical protein
MSWTRKGLVRGDGHAVGHDEAEAGAAEAEEAEAEPAEEAASAAEVWRTLLRVGLAVGMHPDEATEGIVDFALAAGVPFAVVPCCVYSRSFPSRVDSSGRRISSLPRFIEYAARPTRATPCGPRPPLSRSTCESTSS